MATLNPTPIRKAPVAQRANPNRKGNATTRTTKTGVGGKVA